MSTQIPSQQRFSQIGKGPIGDAINWEWVIACAEKSDRDVVIVSRDADYGITLDKASFVNDWLLQEFKKRISQKRRLQLVDKLSTALKILAIPVTPEEELAEEKEQNHEEATPMDTTD